METEDLAFWLSWCIEEYAKSKGGLAPDIAKLFESTGSLRYLSENAEVLHTQGKSYILDCIEKFMQNGNG